jgi:carbamate kinase
MRMTIGSSEAGRVVVALGGNAIAPADGTGTAEEQIRNVGEAMGIVADLVATGREVILTHGNGPQVGALLLKNDLAKDLAPPLPLDWCVAQTQATIGFVMCTELERELAARGLPLAVIPIISRVLVDADDPAFATPTKPIGRYVTDEDEVKAIEAETGQTWARQGSRGWRRVVPSPEPLRLLDGLSMKLVLRAGGVLVANGGGGIPMVADADGRLVGAEAVIDKDLAGVVLACDLGASHFVILTDVDGVAEGYGTDRERWIGEIAAPELRALQQQEGFAVGSMGPKVEAALRFVEAGGPRAAIGSLHDAAAVIAGKAGTQVVGAS